MGHHYSALAALSEFFKQRRRFEDAELLVTGDLTSKGHVDEFDTANDYLVSQIIFHASNPPLRPVGLFAKGWPDRAIPGNHDHWPGRFFYLGSPTPALASYFATMPMISPVLPLGDGRRLRFIRINTDSEVKPSSPVLRLSARGSFQDQLKAAESQLMGQDASNEIRVLLMHHSPDWPNYVLGMTPASRTALESFLDEHDIRVVLTGHTHIPLLKTRTISDMGHQFMEARSGTTTVRDTPPLNWTGLWGGPPKVRLPRNTLLVHELWQRGSAVYWESEIFVRRRQGFLPLGQFMSDDDKPRHPPKMQIQVAP